MREEIDEIWAIAGLGIREMRAELEKLRGVDKYAAELEAELAETRESLLEAGYQLEAYSHNDSVVESRRRDLLRDYDQITLGMYFFIQDLVTQYHSTTNKATKKIIKEIHARAYSLRPPVNDAEREELDLVE